MTLALQDRSKQRMPRRLDLDVDPIDEGNTEGIRSYRFGVQISHRNLFCLMLSMVSTRALVQSTLAVRFALYK